MSGVWIGLAELFGKRTNSLLDGRADAFVWIAAQATDSDPFRARILYTVQDLELTLIDIEQVREIRDRDDVSEALEGIVEQALVNGNNVVYGTFHTFPHHGA